MRDYWLRSYPAEAARALRREDINAGRILFGDTSYMGDSRPFRPGCDSHYFFFPFKFVMDDHKQKTYNNFQIFLKNSLAAMVETIVKFGPLSILLKLTP